MAKFWLMKNEPDCYGIEDLERDGKDTWDGVRNYQVRNFFRDEMNPGDLAFFYHSNADPSGVAGIMRIVSKAYPDPTQFDPKSEYYDAKSSKDEPRWLAVDVEFVERYSEVIPLAVLKETEGLEDMIVNRRVNRLSVTPVTPEEWKIVTGIADRLKSS